MRQRVRLLKVNDEFEINLNRLLAQSWEIYKMYHDRIILFKDFTDPDELAEFDAEFLS
jgi:hypothetical protein